MNYPTCVVIKGKTYNINTDFRVAIRCNEISEDKSIGDMERALGIICTLFGEEAVDDKDNYIELLDYARKYLSCGRDIEQNREEKPDMDFIEDYSYISTSFMSDYHIDLDVTNMHWWRFMDLMEGLSDGDFGNCCILNRIRNLRRYDTKQIKDPKERRKIEEAKKRVALKKYQPKKVEATEEQLKSAEELYKALNI